VRANAAGETSAKQSSQSLALEAGEARTLVHFLGGMSGGQYLLLVEQSRADLPNPLTASYHLTAREIEVLMWVAKGKTNRDIGQILGMSPRTVNKHLEHIYVKLGVETRTAAAALAMGVER
jgi:DNA-binding CsgD family transcriptional regulator